MDRPKMTKGKKPAPLPKLPRTTKRLPRMPRTTAPLPIPLDDEVGVIEGSWNDDGKGDKTRSGRWFDTGKREGSVGGRCAKCGRLRKAENLRLHTLPFGKGEQWQCKEGC